jgi:hypothetical protein
MSESFGVNVLGRREGRSGAIAGRPQYYISAARAAMRFLDQTTKRGID